MKYLTLFIVAFFAVAFSAEAQRNHVPNCSFEEYTTCPKWPGLPMGWILYGKYGVYTYNVCSGNVPKNSEGYQYPAHGRGYVGLTTIHCAGDEKSYIMRTITPLVPGARYEVSMSVSLADVSGLGTNDLGVFFYENGPDKHDTVGTMPVVPQVFYTNYGPITDTANWLRLSKTFVADSAYSKIVIGGFLKPGDQKRDTFQHSCLAHYYVDSIVVRVADSFMLNPDDVVYCAGDTVNMKYVALNGFKAGNVFTVQMSDAVGSFASAVNIGSVQSTVSGTVKCMIPANAPTGSGYRFRIIASSDKDTSNPYGYTYRVANVSKPVAAANSPLCIGDTLKLTATSANTDVSYSWWGPSGPFSPLQNPVIHPVTASYNGNYVLTSELNGCYNRDTTVVAISSNAVTHDYAKSNSPVCTDDTIRLSSKFTMTGLSFNWQGPGGFTSSSQNTTIPQATTGRDGLYILTVKNGNCEVKDTIAVSITQRPAVVEASANVLCDGEDLKLAASSTFAGYSYSWIGPDGFNSTSKTPVIAKATAVNTGKYILSGFYRGCTMKDTVDAVVKPFPSKPVAGSDQVLCAGQSINLGVTFVNGVYYSWAGPGGYTATVENPVIANSTTAMSGNYIVSADLNGCKKYDTTFINIMPSPARVALGSNSPVCAGNNLSLSASPNTPGANYIWTGPDNFSSTQLNTGITNSTATATGRYKLTANLNGCVIEDSINVIVQAIPAAPVIGYNAPLCIGEDLKLNTHVLGGASYVWTGPNGFTSNAQTPLIKNASTATSGQYRAVVTIHGCASQPGNVNVTVNPSPFVTILSNPYDSTCGGDVVVFTPIPTHAGGTPRYDWLINKQYAGTGNTFTTALLNPGDVVLCKMTEYTQCSAPYVDESNEVYLTILPRLTPAVSITANPDRPLSAGEYVTYTATATHGGVLPQFQWYRNGQQIVGATGNSWGANTLDNQDEISVEMTSVYKCPRPAAKVQSNKLRVLVNPVAVNDVEIVGSLNIYPNPNNGNFTIQGNNFERGVFTLSIINQLGQVVYTQHLDAPQGILQHEISAEGLASGVYMLRIQNEKGSMSGRITIK